MLPAWIAKAGKEDSMLARWQQSVHNLQWAATAHPASVSCIFLMNSGTQGWVMTLNSPSSNTIHFHIHPYIYMCVYYIYLINPIFFKKKQFRKKDGF